MWMVQLGFCVGRAETLELMMEIEVRDFQRLFGEICALTRELQISRTLMFAI